MADTEEMHNFTVTVEFYLEAPDYETAHQWVEDDISTSSYEYVIIATEQDKEEESNQ